MFQALLNMANHELSFLLLVLTLSILSASCQVQFLSIDCGSSASSYQDENLITWTGDDDYIKTGESYVVPSNYSINHVFDTLRVFKNGRKKNCYNINSIKQGRVLLRVYFYYGNYDGKSSPPTFQLQYDGNYWATATSSTDEYYYYEVIYTMKSDFISVCVAQTIEDQFPLLSAIQVRALDTFMYGHISSEYPLFTLRRVAYGLNSTTSIRYGDDPYDRIWQAPRPRNGSNLIAVRSPTSLTEITAAYDRPPHAVLQNAITSIISNGTINLISNFHDFEFQVYINWYFTELTQLEPNETRSFQIFIGDELVSDPIMPLYLNCTEWTISNYTVSSNNTIDLVPTNVSTLPPLVSAMEVFAIPDALTNGTNIRDVEGLRALRNAFPVLREWGGDPCLPATFKWEWIYCSSDTTPRVTAVLLGSFGLSGVLPDFSSMDALGSIDLHNNSFSGPIPDFLGTFPVLTVLNLANNQFNGSIPASLSNKSGLQLILAGNPGLCTASNSSCPSSTDLPGHVNAVGSIKKKNILHMMLNAAIYASFVWFFMF